MNVLSESDQCGAALRDLREAFRRLAEDPVESEAEALELLHDAEASAAVLRDTAERLRQAVEEQA